MSLPAPALPCGRPASRSTSRAQLRPFAPVTPPPGWVPAPQRYSPRTGVRYCAHPLVWPKGEELVERHVAVQGMTTGHAEETLEVERAQDLAVHDESGRSGMTRARRSTAASATFSLMSSHSPIGQGVGLRVHIDRDDVMAVWC